MARNKKISLRLGKYAKRKFPGNKLRQNAYKYGGLTNIKKRMKRRGRRH